MIEKSEYRGRQQRFAAALVAKGFDAALIVSRGGSTFDRYAHVRYLTGHYQNYSYLPDAAGLFSGRAHAAAIISPDGKTILCVSVPEWDADALVTDDIRACADFALGIADALIEAGAGSGRVCLIGADVLPMRYWLQLVACVPDAEFVAEDEVLAGLMRVKSPAEQVIIQRGVALHRSGVSALLAAIRPGVSEADLVAVLAEAVIRGGAAIYFASVSSGLLTSRWTSSPLPGFSLRKLETGDLVRFDTGIIYEGYLSDFGRSLVVGEPTPAQRRLLDTLHRGLESAIGAVRPGARVRDIVAAGEAALEEAGVVSSGNADNNEIFSSFPVHWGHGLGLGWERPWLTNTEDMVIEPGMYIAIERALTLAGIGTAAAEQTLLVGADGAEILTAGPRGFWS